MNFYFMRLSIFILFFLATNAAFGQELYVYSEPASNMPAHTISTKLKAVIGPRAGNSLQRYTPEVMFGLSKSFMLHGAASFSNMLTPGVQWEGAYLYGKYRFLSIDGIHRHFRMAAFSEIGYSQNPIAMDELSIRGENSGIDAGVIATHLVDKLAISGTASYLKVFEKEVDKMPHPMATSAINYSLSAGYLILPVKYKSYEQLNFNIYAELLGQQTFEKETYFVDAAPAIQFIFNSTSKLNLGYRFQLKGNALRAAKESFQVSFEHTFFNK